MTLHRFDNDLPNRPTLRGAAALVLLFAVALGSCGGGSGGQAGDDPGGAVPANDSQWDEIDWDTDPWA